MAFHQIRFKLCLTVSAEVTVWGFVCHSFVICPFICPCHIYLRNLQCIGRISFKFQLLLALAQTFLNFWKKMYFLIFHDFLLLSLTWDPYVWEEKCQNATPPSNRFWIFPNCSCIFYSLGPHKSSVWEFWNFEFYNFSGIFLWKFRFHHCVIVKHKTAIISKRSHRKTKRSEIWVWWVSIQCIEGTLTVNCSRSFWRYSVHLRSLTTLCLENGWLQSESNENLGLGGNYLVYAGYFWQLSA